jgi:hypothetical protein
MASWWKKSTLSSSEHCCCPLAFYSNATKNPETFKLRYFCIKSLTLQWILGIHSQREKPGLLCWITVVLRMPEQDLRDRGLQIPAASEYMRQ